MAHFITTNAVAVIATLGGLLVACAGLLFAAFLRRARQRNAVRRLLELSAAESRVACDAVTSKVVHDLNNILLVLSMEAERLEGSEQAEILQQVITEGREIVERCRAQFAAVGPSPSNLCAELRAVTGLLSDAGITKADVAITNAVPAVVMVPGSATDIHMLVLAMVRAAGVGISPEQLSLTVSKGRDAALPVDDNDSGWVNVAAACPELLDEDAEASIALSRVARRLSGEVVLPDPGRGRRRLAVSLPVIGG